MRKKKILYVITKSVWGGAGRHVYDLAISVDRNIYDVFVAAGGKNELAEKIIKSGIPYLEIKNFQKDASFFKDIFAYLEMLFLLLKIRPDIIHVNSSKAGGIVGVAAFDYRFLSLKFGIKTIFTAHGWAFHEERPKWQISLIKIFTKITAFFYSKIICVSEFDRLSAIKNHITPIRKLITIHNGIDYQKISFLKREEAQKKLIGKTSSLVVGTIAEWTKNKGLFYLLEALMKFKNKNFDAVFIGSGQNPDKKEMYDFTKKYNLKNVHLIEWIPDAFSYLKAFDIFVLPSIKEGLPYTILEAGFAELPVVATKVGGIPEIIGHDEGILVDAGNSDELAENIENLMDNPEKRKLMATALRRKIMSDFSLEKMLRSTFAIYEKD